MSGYEASARIVKASPRLAHQGRAADSPRATESIAPVEIVILSDRSEQLSLLQERLEAVRERWSQLTFFLFDADSWRT